MYIFSLISQLVTSQNSYVGALTSNVTVLGDKAYEEEVMVK